MAVVSQPPSTEDDPLPDLVRALRHTSVATRVRAAKDLGRLGWLARDGLPALLEAAEDDDAKVRESAAHAVGQLGPDALPGLVRLLSHDDKYVRRHAAWGLGRLGPLARPALPDLCRALRDSDPRTGSAAAQAIGNMGADGADGVAALAEAMRGTNIVLCRLAAKALSQVGSPALATLIAHLQHTDPFVRGESALGLGWMGATARLAVPFLVKVVRGPGILEPADTPDRALPNPNTPPPLFPTAGDPRRTPITPPITPAPCGNSPDDNCRVYAAQALGRIGPVALEAVDELEAVARTAAEPLRSVARQAIRLIQGQR